MLCLAGVLAVTLRADVSLSRVESAAVALLASLAGWTALSAIWSSAPSSSVDEAARTLVYLAAAVAIALLGGRGELPSLLAGLLGGLAALTDYGLVRYLFEHPAFDRYEGFHLFRPVGYANAFGLVAALGLLLGLGFAGRAAAGAALPLFAVALYLTSSRGAWLALAVGGIVALALDPKRGRMLASLLATAPFGAAAVVLAARSNVLAGADARRLLALWIVLLAAGAGIAARLSARLDVGRAAVAALAGCAVAAVAVVSVHGLSAGRDRTAYWHVAWREYVAHPVLGSGAGTFERFWIRDRTIPVGARDAHNLYLETLAELGPLGLGLLAAAFALPLAGAARARRVPLVPAASGAFVAYVVHAAVDWDWELPAVTVAGLACGLAVLSAARDPGRPVPRALVLWSVSALAVLAFALAVRTSAY